MNNKKDVVADSRQLSLLDQVRRVIRLKHYSIRTEQVYVAWIKRFISFNNKRHPIEMGSKEIVDFLSYLAIERNVAPNTQSQALNAILFLYNKVLQKPIETVADFARPKKKQKLPVVLTQNEIRNLLKELNGSYWLAACLLYGLNSSHKCIIV